ncbi:hypothetical protein N7472_004180 [Penicillium cf. griseofulvum]|uniref:Uncharacterized protein n=1 Tax=Penicillium cf. griseofulvum TaxID=2972120 RepID=A0A9W9JSD8_9EURO|nr:hypothetical protein N7472_004180 [Penicillium cf. griseofulvum]
MTYTSLLALPFELWASIAPHYLSNPNMNLYRLACNKFNNELLHHLDLVLLSASLLNVATIITELLCDEAWLPKGPQRLWENNEGHGLLSDKDAPSNTREWARTIAERIVGRHKSKEEDGRRMWLKKACKEAWTILGGGAETWSDLTMLRVENGQEAVLADNSDMHALLYGTKQFPALRESLSHPQPIAISWSTEPDPYDPRFP